MSEFGKYLRPGESIARSTGVSAKALIADAVGLAAVVAAYWMLTQYLQQLGSGSPLAASFAPLTRTLFAGLTLLVALIAVYAVGVICLRAAFTRYGLTDSRVLRRSFLRMRGADLVHVQDVEVVQGLLGKVLGFGDVLVRTASTDGLVTLRRVDRPDEWFREIHEAVRLRQTSS